MTDETKSDNSFEATQARHFAQCVKEAKFCAAVWIVAWIFCTVFIYKFGYIPPELRPDDPWLILGMPGWVVVGVFTPWLLLIALTIWFAKYYIKDDEPLVEFPKTADAKSQEKESVDD